MQWKKRQRIGMPINIPSCGESDDAIVRPTSAVLFPSELKHCAFSNCTTKLSALFPAGVKVRCYAVEQDAAIRDAFKEQCQMLFALHLVQDWQDCLWERGLSWANMVKEE